ncbi:ParB N-terminal domain-containing protein [Chromobacterium violaceum]|uniref:ParB N-terminal domain-containing protein n=1 Tax=Chromobacterium violaceum TaxID=536 RepID=UPI00143CF435|nr:ParB N-terminal domain-containing protein [Chromobacterium violaceum]QIY78356.1 ParB N-terminal domain-containing protein [Chromobacterium violaceum]
MSDPVLSKLHLESLDFDPENPRLPNRLKHASEEKVLQYLLMECNLIELMLSIGQQGFFIGEPLLVTPGLGGRYVVVEGNRRLGALKMLQDSNTPPVMATKVSMARASAKFKPSDDIPVLVFEKRDEILTYLGYRHITGVQDWDSLAKARYLKQLYERYEDLPQVDAYKTLAKEIGSNSNHVAKLLTGLELLGRASESGLLVKLNLTEDDIPFSLLTTGIGYEGISRFIGIDGVRDTAAQGLKEKEFEEFFRWVFEKGPSNTTVLGDSRKFEKLARIVSNQTALMELRQGRSIDEADLLTEGPLNAVRKLLKEAEYRLSTAQVTLSSADGFDGNDVLQAERLVKAARNLHASLKSIIDPQDDIL